GSAAAVAAGLCPMALGADGGGSIRIPAALCGVVGLKPTWSRVSTRGAFELAWSVGHLGPLGATVRDCALLYAAVAGPDPKDRFSTGQPAPRDVRPWLEADDLRGLRIGVYRPYFDDAEPDLVRACERALTWLEDAGASVREITIAHLERARVAHMITIASEMATAVEPYRAAHGRAFGLDVRINLAVARSFSATDYVKAQRVRTRVIKHWSRLLAPDDGVDLIASPTTGCAATPIREDALTRGESDLETLGRIMRFAAPANLTGFPAISAPVGYDFRGLPIGLQLVARPWEENLLFKTASILERSTARRRPARHHDLLAPWSEPG
ncbi:MAG: amidase, partial [Myxococcales bacterium]|nr:amidase [Myxococcales bacterium]